MPILLALLAAAGGIVFWMMRARNAAHAAQDLADMAGDVMSAARRFGFRRRHDEHPVDSLQDRNVAVAGIGLSFLELGALPTAEQHEALLISLQHRLGMTEPAAREAAILGRWLMQECSGAQQGLTRLARRLYKLGGADGFSALMDVLRDVAAKAEGTLAPRQKDALEEIGRIWKLR